MPITQLSYHICDFLEDTHGRLYVLELGDAIYNSSFRGRYEFSGVDVKAKIFQHCEALFNHKDEYVRFRNEKHAQRRMKYFSDEEDTKKPDTSKPTIIAVKEDSNDNHDYHVEYIQELTAQMKKLPQSEAAFILNGVTDILWLCNFDKRVLNTVLSLNNLSDLQPRTWSYECSLENTAFEIPADINYFVIKSTNASLAEGMLVVPKEDLLLVLTAIAHRDIAQLPEDKRASYEVGIKYYSKKSYSPQLKHQNLLIQELCFSKTKARRNKENNLSYHHAVGRAVFAVIEEEGKTRIEMIDLCWQLAIAPENQDHPTFHSNVSSKSEKNSEPSFTAEEKQRIEPKITTILTTIYTAAKKLDIRTYLLSLYSKNKIADIEYILKLYSHIRIDCLDQDLISTLTTVNPKLTERYLINQAKYFLLPHHLEFTQDQVLEQWLNTHAANFTTEVKSDLKKYIEDDAGDLKALNIKEINVPYRERMERLTNKLQEVKQSYAQSLSFIGGERKHVTSEDTSSANNSVKLGG